MTIAFIGDPKAEVKAQDIFKTANFGFDIFTPFSQNWKQSVIEGGVKAASDWSVAPQADAESPRQMEKNWKGKYDAFAREGEIWWDAFPSGSVRAQSAQMAKELADIFYDSQLINAKDMVKGAEDFKATSGDTRDYLTMHYALEK